MVSRYRVGRIAYEYSLTWRRCCLRSRVGNPAYRRRHGRFNAPITSSSPSPSSSFAARLMIDPCCLHSSQQKRLGVLRQSSFNGSIRELHNGFWHRSCAGTPWQLSSVRYSLHAVPCFTARSECPLLVVHYYYANVFSPKATIHPLARLAALLAAHRCALRLLENFTIDLQRSSTLANFARTPFVDLSLS